MAKDGGIKDGSGCLLPGELSEFMEMVRAGSVRKGGVGDGVLQGLAAVGWKMGSPAIDQPPGSMPTRRSTSVSTAES